MRRSLRRAALALCLLALLPGRIRAHDDHAEEAPPSIAPTNATCPVRTGTPVDPSVYTDWHGRRIGFCCTRCRAIFLADPEAYAASVEELVPPEEEGHDHAGAAATHHDDEPAHVHDHAKDHGTEQQGLGAWIGWFGRLHPVAVHFPIALTLAAFLADLLLLVTGETRHEGSVRYLLALAGLSVLVTVPLGWAAGTATLSADLAGDLAWHRWLGTTACPLLLAAWIARERFGRAGNGSGRNLSRILLAGASLLILATAFFGGNLVFGPGHLTLP